MVDATYQKIGPRIDARTAQRQRAADTGFRLVTLFFAVLVLAILGGVILSLIIGAMPALQTFGFGFVATEI